LPKAHFSKFITVHPVYHTVPFLFFFDTRNLFLILLDELLDLSPPPARRSARAPNGLRADVPPAPDRLPVPITRDFWRFIYLPYF